MSRIKWYYNRLHAMNIKEIFWRIKQAFLYKREKYFILGKPIIDENLNHLEKSEYKQWFKMFGEKNEYIIGETDLIFGEISIKDVNSHYAFNNDKHWKLKASMDLKYKQRDDIGDARVNWEMNRHYHFQILAKNYIITKDKLFLDILESKVDKWIEENPFLVGISYTSEMELAIRAFSWYITADLLYNCEEASLIVKKLQLGTLNLLTHVDNHHSCFSSANNHLLVEMSIIGIVGISFQNKEWINKALSIICYELERQNFEDGVNKEQSIHYQTFVMEAIALFLCRLKSEQMEYPKTIENILRKMCEFTADLMDKNKMIPHLGDNDEGKIFDLYGLKINHYEYVLELCGRLLGINYLERNTNTKNTYDQVRLLSQQNCLGDYKGFYDTSASKVYEIGGHSIIKSEFKDVLMTFDHSELGFDAIAAHGHADSLHITLSVNGNPIFIDPGTYVYHTKLKWRNYFRMTINHNTIEIDGRDQSTMLGAFLWGKRANTTLNSYILNKDNVLIDAMHDGYAPIIHQRIIKYNGKEEFEIIDKITKVTKSTKYILSFVLDSNCEIKENNNSIVIRNSDAEIILSSSLSEYVIDDIYVSNNYFSKKIARAIRYKGITHSDLQISTSIIVN